MMSDKLWKVHVIQFVNIEFTSGKKQADKKKPDKSTVAESQWESLIISDVSGGITFSIRGRDTRQSGK